jgi:hypothetical protein
MILGLAIASYLAMPAAMAAPPMNARVEKILSAREVLMTAATRVDCTPGQVFALYPQGEEKDPEPVGFADAYERFGERQCLAKVKSHSQSGLIRAGDPAAPVDLYDTGQEIPGRYDLVREGRREYASLYKPTVYAGYLFGQTASTLDRGEFLVGAPSVMYGIRNNFQVDFTYLRLFEQVAEAGVKYKFYSNEDMRFSIYFQNSRFLNIGKDAWAAELQYDSSDNSRSMSHTKLRFSSKVPSYLALSDKEKEKDSSLELSTVNEWMLKSWHRVLFGPKFIAGQEYDLGFLFSFLYVRKIFHVALNLNINSVRRFDPAKNRQMVGLDFFWRF